MTLSSRDEQGRTLTLAREPQRIVSLVPSDTYNLFALGAGERVVGRTDYCVEPAAALRCPSVGGTKNVDVAHVLALKPDLVVANREENRRLDIERLLAAGAPVLLSLPTTVMAGITHCERLLSLLPSLAATAADTLARAREKCTRLATVQAPAVDTFVPIWMDPLMTVAADTFISDVVALVGGRNVFANRPRRYPLGADLGRREALPAEAIEGRDTRYPRVTLDEVVARRPELVLLPDEPHTFTLRDAAVFEALDIPAAGGGIHLCAGRALMWYGLAAIAGLDSLAALLKQARQRRGGAAIR